MFLHTFGDTCQNDFVGRRKRHFANQSHEKGTCQNQKTKLQKIENENMNQKKEDSHCFEEDEKDSSSQAVRKVLETILNMWPCHKGKEYDALTNITLARMIWLSAESDRFKIETLKKELAAAKKQTQSK
jgi:hypothetical protein